jgi:peptide/nickel transport system substrate-binding protein
MSPLEAARRPVAAARSPFTIAAVAAVTAAGCATGESGAPGATYTHVVPAHLMEEWHPALMYSREPTAMRNVYETLLAYDHESEEIRPLLATDWHVSEDGLRWSFDLRDDVVFHDGEPMTAESVKAAVEHTIDLEGSTAYLWESVAEITASEEHTVVFDLDYPAPLDLIAASAYGAYIYQVPEDDDPEAGQDSDFYAAGLGTGPYTVQEYNTNQEYELTLVQHPDYWGGWQDQFDTVEFRVVPEPSTAGQLLERGEVDSVQELPTRILEPLGERDDVQIRERTSVQNLIGALNTEHGPLGDADMRRGVAHGIDYDEIIEALDGDMSRAQGYVPQGLFGSDTGNELRDFDPDQAREHLAEAGHDPEHDQVSLVLTYNESEDRPRIVAEMMQSQLAELGIDLDLQGMPREPQNDRARHPDPAQRQDIHLGNWWPDTPEAHSWYSALWQTQDEPSFNFAYYSNPELDAMIEGVGEVSATDREAAEQVYRDMEAIVITDVPGLVFGEVNYRRAMSSDVQGYLDDPMYAHTLFAYELRRE